MALSTFSIVLLAAVLLIAVLQIALPSITGTNDETNNKKESAIRRARSSKKLNEFLSSASHRKHEQERENGTPRRPLDTKEALDQFSQSTRGKVIKSIAKAVSSSQVIEGKPITGQSATVGRKDSRTVSAIDAVNNQDHDNMRQSEPDYHVVFSTSCDLQQHWESYLFFYYAMKVKQPGNITRICSGCNQEGAETLLQFHKDYIEPMSTPPGRFHLHLTPNFGEQHLEKGQSPYKYMNKPFGLRHWMEEHLGLHPNKTTPTKVDDSIVILMDPDMILLRPIVHNYSNEQVIWVEGKPATKVVRHGYPIAQQDGYLGNEWMLFNWSYITQKPPDQIKGPPKDRKQGPLHWNSGPPYLATVRDMYKLACRWTEYAPRVLEIFPSTFSEMYGLVMASVELELPFTFIQSLVVSVTETLTREGWDYIDALPHDLVCANDDETKRLQQQHPLPIALHYCQRYWLGKWFFSKYRVKKNIMNCEKPLLELPPKGIHLQYNYTYTPPRADGLDKRTWKEKHEPISKRFAKREAFFLCHMTTHMNEALRYYKQAKCSHNNINLNETYSVYRDPAAY